MVGWHHQFDGQEFEQAPGVVDGQGSLVYCSPWGCKEWDTTEQLYKDNNGYKGIHIPVSVLLYMFEIFYIKIILKIILISVYSPDTDRGERV